MKPAKNIQPDLKLADGDSDIPAGVDAFLRELARWAVEDRQFTAAVNPEDSRSISKLVEFDESAGFEHETFLKSNS